MLLKTISFALLSLSLAGCSEAAEPVPPSKSSELLEPGAVPADGAKIPPDEEGITTMLQAKFGKAVRAVRVDAAEEAGGLRVKLRGEVPSEEIKEAVMKEVTSRVEGLRVQDYQLVVSGIVPLIGVVEAEVGPEGTWFSDDLRFGIAFEREGLSDPSPSLWDLWSRARINRLTPVGHERMVHVLAFSPDGKRLATGHAHGQVVLWSLPRGRMESIFLEARDVLTHNDVGSLAWSPDGISLACVQRTPGEIWIWDTKTKEGRLLGSHLPNAASFLEFSPDGKTLSSASDKESKVILWDVSERKKKGELGGVSVHLEALAWSPDRKSLAAGRTVSEQGVVVWDVGSGKYRVLAPENPGLITDIGYSPDGKLLATRHDGIGVVLWDTATWKEWTRLPLDKVGAGKGMGFSPDSSTMALGCKGMEPWTLGPTGFQLWDISNRPGGKRNAAEFPPEKFEPLTAYDDYLEYRMLKRIGRDFGSIPNLDLHMELRPDGSVRLWGKASANFVKEVAQRTIETEFPIETKSGKTPRTVINEIVVDDPYERYRKDTP